MPSSNSASSSAANRASTEISRRTISRPFELMRSSFPTFSLPRSLAIFRFQRPSLTCQFTVGQVQASFEEPGRKIVGYGGGNYRRAVTWLLSVRGKVGEETDRRTSPELQSRSRGDRSRAVSQTAAARVIWRRVKSDARDPPPSIRQLNDTGTVECRDSARPTNRFAGCRF